VAQATDYVIDNGTGANVRTDLNAVFQAVQTNNSGAAAPGAAVSGPFQWWADTTTSKLKIRSSSSGTTWYEVGDLDTANLGLLTTTSAASTYLAKAGGTVTGALEIGAAGSLVFEGSTADTFETTLAVVDPTADRTITLPNATGTVPLLSLAQTFSAAQRGSISSFTSSSGTATPDFALANNFSITLSENATLANPSNVTAGQSGCIFISQDATGGRTLAYGANWDFAGGNQPNLSNAANAVDLLVYTVRTTTSIQAQLIANFS
jgi:hypothetical protein